jgi:predicted MFS family arabinose efflux permease
MLFARVWASTGGVLVVGILPHLMLNLHTTVPPLGASPAYTAPLYAVVALAVPIFAGAPRPAHPAGEA